MALIGRRVSLAEESTGQRRLCIVDAERHFIIEHRFTLYRRSLDTVNQETPVKDAAFESRPGGGRSVDQEAGHHGERTIGRPGAAEYRVEAAEQHIAATARRPAPEKPARPGGGVRLRCSDNRCGTARRATPTRQRRQLGDPEKPARTFGAAITTSSATRRRYRLDKPACIECRRTGHEGAALLQLCSCLSSAQTSGAV